MNYKQRREAYEINAGGKETIEYMGEYKTVGKAGKCVCGQTSYTVYLCQSKKTLNKHWIGTCCINHYQDTKAYGGKHGIKQASVIGLIDNWETILGEKITEKETAIIAGMRERLGYYGKIKLYCWEKKLIEASLGITVRFNCLNYGSIYDVETKEEIKVREAKNRERIEQINKEVEESKRKAKIRDEERVRVEQEREREEEERQRVKDNEKRRLYDEKVEQYGRPAITGSIAAKQAEDNRRRLRDGKR